MQIEKAVAEINNLARDEEENRGAYHQGNSCDSGNTHVFSST